MSLFQRLTVCLAATLSFAACNPCTGVATGCDSNVFVTREIDATTTELTNGKATICRASACESALLTLPEGIGDGTFRASGATVDAEVKPLASGRFEAALTYASDVNEDPPPGKFTFTLDASDGSRTLLHVEGTPTFADDNTACPSCSDATL